MSDLIWLSEAQMRRIEPGTGSEMNYFFVRSSLYPRSCAAVGSLHCVTRRREYTDRLRSLGGSGWLREMAMHGEFGRFVHVDARSARFSLRRAL